MYLNVSQTFVFLPFLCFFKVKFVDKYIWSCNNFCIRWFLPMWEKLRAKERPSVWLTNYISSSNRIQLIFSQLFSCILEFFRLKYLKPLCVYIKATNVKKIQITKNRMPLVYILLLVYEILVLSAVICMST